MPSFDVIIVGAGAAGLMCAIQAGRRGRRVLVADHAATIGKKILISGGGRCNFTNLRVGPQHFVSENPDFCRSALARFTPEDFLTMVRAHGIAYHEKTLGQLFCDRSARDILHMLEAECEKAGVTIQPDCRVDRIEPRDRFHLATNRGDCDTASLVVATGGISVPATGASDFGYRVAEQFGLDVVPPAPALVGLKWTDADRALYGGLSGVSTEVIATCRGASFRESLLFTHTGLSGPAILQASLYWSPGEPVSIDWLPGRDGAGELLRIKTEGGKAELKSVLARSLPKRLAEVLGHIALPSKPLAQCADTTLRNVAARLQAWTIMPAGTEGYRKAEVTRGGVDTRELSSKTMEAAKVPGLYFIGEVVDVTGQLGGYNFHWAWASGWAAGQVV